MWVKIRIKIVWESNTIHSLGMKIDYGLTLEKHLSETYEKAKNLQHKENKFLKKKVKRSTSHCITIYCLIVCIFITGKEAK